MGLMYDGVMGDKPLRSIEPHEVEAFSRDGAVLLKGVLGPDWLDVLSKGLDEAIAKPNALSSGVDTSLRTDQFPCASSPALRRIIDESPVAEIVGRALSSGVRFYMDQMFYKPAGVIPATPWHQDTCYYNVEGDDLIRAWVSPDPVPREASIEVVRGSHRWNITYRPLAGRDPELDPSARAEQESAKEDEPMLGEDSIESWNYWKGVRDMTLPLVPDIEAHRDSFEILGWDYEPGDVLLFHGNILHAAGGNVTLDHPRRAHASIWAGEDVHYLHRVGQVIPDPAALFRHKPRSGQPLSDFPDVFPLKWSPSA
jgi:ectoine hydroxylase-related dioxygenase (phytanoyl-CoA dioxygenase family)